MANTILTAKNGFAEGLIMDFSPDNTSSNSLTSALNATLLTFNGNEMALQNDFGNGRVETAYLPEGYIPVGTCEFGDIIYIVSYNPIINKSQIGCFPSPERNISSDEVGAPGQSIKWTDFQVSSNGESNGVPTGRLKASSVKKVLYGNKNMNSGDKYIIYSEDLNTNNNAIYLSDYKNSIHQHNKFPKLVKIHVVSVEESGKIVYLDSTTKWYKENDFYISQSAKTDSENNEDLDTHRARVNSAYSVFSSKVSGKLALLIELEKITGFSCSWVPYVVGEDAMWIDNTNTSKFSSFLRKTKYKIYWNFNWTTNDNNINPNGIVLTKSNWTGVEKAHEGQYQVWEQDGEGKIKLDTGWKDYSWINPSAGGTEYNIPKAYPDTNYYEAIVSRKYAPEDNIPFENFLAEYEYSTYLETTLNQIIGKTKQEGREISETELLTTPYKLNIYRTNGLPEEGRYLVNCNNIINGVYYTTNLRGELQKIDAVELNDDLVNNYFHYPIIKEFTEFAIPTKQELIINAKDTYNKIPNINNLIYHYKIAPTMPYGILEEFAQDGYIDFGKIGTGSIEVSSWKYFNYENTSTLTWGMDAYTEPGKGISEVVFEFYDNTGFAAAYHNKGKLSYNGTFTEYITLNESGSNYKLNNIPANSPNNQPRYHKGAEVTIQYMRDHPDGIYVNSNATKVSVSGLKDDSAGPFYQDDSGTLYSNYLYLVKIIIKYSIKGALEEYIDDPSSYITKYRWYWTNTMFNEYYYSVKDFKELQFTLNLDFNAQYKQSKNIFDTTIDYEVPNNEVTEVAQNEYTQLKAKVTTINQAQGGLPIGNIGCKLQSGLYNDYNMFNLNADELINFKISVYLGKSYMEAPDQPEVITSEEVPYTFPGIYPTDDTENFNEAGYIAKLKPTQIGPTLGKLLHIENASGPELNESEEAYKNYKNSFSLTFPEMYNKVPSGLYSKVQTKLDYSYINYKGEVVEMPSVQYVTFNRLEQFNMNSGHGNIQLTCTGVIYSKYYEYKAVKNISAYLVRPILYKEGDLGKYNMHFYDGHFYFNTIGGIVWGCGEDANSGRKTRWRKGEADKEGIITSTYSLGGETHKDGMTYTPMYNQTMQKTDHGQLGDVFPGGIIPFIFSQEKASDHNWGYRYQINTKKDSKDTPIAQQSFLHVAYFGNTSFTVDPFAMLPDGGLFDDMNNVKNSNLLMMLALRDSNNVVHILNTFIPIQGTAGRITQNIRYKDAGMSANNPTTLGDAVASVLMNLYYTTGEDEKNLPYICSQNFVHLAPHSYIFTKDIIFQIEEDIKDKNTTTTNDLILIHKMRYPEYIEAVLNVAYPTGGVSDSNAEPQLTKNDPNVSLKLLGIEKNSPLQFKFDYKIPIQKDLNITSTWAAKRPDGSIIFPNSSFVQNNLYFQSEEDPTVFNVLKPGSAFKYTEFDNFRISEVGQILGDDTGNTHIHSLFGNAFEFYDNILRCRNTDAYSISESQMFTIIGWQDTWAGMWPINTVEIFLPMGELVHGLGTII